MATAAVRVSEQRMGSVKSKSFELSLPPLTVMEGRVYGYLKRAAANGVAATYPEMCEDLRISYQYGTLPGVIGRLIEKGYVENVLGYRLQRGLWLRIVDTGDCTADPGCRAKHWRDVPDRVPVPAIHTLRQSDLSLAQWIEAEARRINRDHLAFLEELVRRGAQDYRAEMECEQ